jgi:hypothetical protein
MNVTLKLTLDGLVQALRWRQIDYLENPAQQMQALNKTDAEAERPNLSPKRGVQNAQ